MPRGDPFTQFCQQITRTGRTVVADLHLHSTASDGAGSSGVELNAAERLPRRAPADVEPATVLSRLASLSVRN